jgi:aminopeptidase N
VEQVQQGQMPFYLPIQLALVDRQGQDLPGSVMTFHLKDTSAELVFENIPEEPAFASLNRDYSFYGTFVNRSATEDTLISQVKLDCNRYSKVDAFQRLTDIERITLIKDPRARISNRWLALYGELIDNATLPSSVKAFMLRIDEQPHDRAYLTWYQEQVTAREKLMKSVNAVYRDQLLHQFRALDTYSPEKRLLPHDGIEDRMLKNILLELITIDDTPESHALLVEHYRCATTATDKVAALTLLNRSSAPMRRQLLEEVYAAWHQNLSGYANYLRVISAGTCEDVFSMIEAEIRRPTFDITQPTWQRALFLPMAVNNKMLWSDAGIAWLTYTIK